MGQRAHEVLLGDGVRSRPRRVRRRRRAKSWVPDYKEFGGEHQAQPARRLAGSFRRVLLGPRRRWQQYAGVRPAALWQATYDRQESLQHILRIFDVEIKQQRAFKIMFFISAVFHFVAAAVPSCGFLAWPPSPAPPPGQMEPTRRPRPAPSPRRCSAALRGQSPH